MFRGLFKGLYHPFLTFDLDTRRNAAGTEYAVVKLTADRALDEEEIAAVLAIRAEYATLVRELLIDAADYEFEA